jgi:hypothetical protein
MVEVVETYHHQAVFLVLDVIVQQDFQANIVKYVISLF